MFQDLTVVELASVLAGPSVGQFFAELGANVIKVENINTGGDVTRSWKLPSEEIDTDLSAYFCSVNWGKKSWALDLNSAESVHALHQLIKRADIVIASYKPGDAEKLGVSYDQLRAVNAKLIFGQITGYGSDNARVGYDAVIQAEAGFMDLNGEAHGSAVKMPVALMDVLAAHHLKEGLLLALLKRERTGSGGLVEVSLIQAAVASLANQASNWLVAGVVPKRKGSLHPNIAPYGEVFELSDGKQMIVAIGTDKQFADFCHLLNADALALHASFRSNMLRVMHRAELYELLKPKVNAFSSLQLMPLFHQRKIPAGLIQNLAEVFSMPEAQHLVLQHSGLHGVRTFVVHGVHSSFALTPPPHLGEHNNEIQSTLFKMEEPK